MGSQKPFDDHEGPKTGLPMRKKNGRIWFLVKEETILSTL